ALALLLTFSYPSAAEDRASLDAKWPDLSRIPPDSDVLHDATRKLSALLSSLHMQVVKQEEFPGQDSEHTVQPPQLADHFAAFKRHQLASRQKPRDQLLSLGLQFQADLEKWICEELSENQRRWLFSQHIATNGYKGIDCGWLATALELSPDAREEIRSAVREAKIALKDLNPSLVSRTSDEWPAYVRSLKDYYATLRKSENQLIYPLLNKSQQRFVRTAEESAGL
ncbi:MAG: hypothetical protein AAGG44_03175, partial [Planctomycetota bacterium]